MYLRKIALRHFRNYTRLLVEPPKGIICLEGDNGAGKTNFLEAIYYACMCKSAWVSDDRMLRQYHADTFEVYAYFQRENRCDEASITRSHHAKRMRLNTNLIASRKAWIGQFAVLSLAPYDVQRLTEQADARRQFFDRLFLQINPLYAEKWFEYRQFLKARNHLLFVAKKENRPIDETLLNTYDECLIAHAKTIATKRKQFLKPYIDLFNKHYSALSHKDAPAFLSYQTHALDEDFEKQFRDHRTVDILRATTTLGIHRDDYPIAIHRPEHAAKFFASQGQSKTLALALTLAHFDSLAKEKGYFPILLLDDVMDKLDAHRTKYLFELLAKKLDTTHRTGLFLLQSMPKTML